VYVDGRSGCPGASGGGREKGTCRSARTLCVCVCTGARARESTRAIECETNGFVQTCGTNQPSLSLCLFLSLSVSFSVDRSSDTRLLFEMRRGELRNLASLACAPLSEPRFEFAGTHSFAASTRLSRRGSSGFMRAWVRAYVRPAYTRENLFRAQALEVD